MKPKRPILRWHGGKWKLADWIISHFPEHKVYVEPFGGAASVLLQKPASYAEIYNDLDQEVVNLFSMARENGNELIELLQLTPFSRQEFELAYQPTDNKLEQARRTVVRSFMGFGSNAHAKATGFRSNSNRSGTTPAHDWANLPDQYKLIIERLRGVVIENRDANKVMLHHDTPETLHYVDPPYTHDTRYNGKDYNFEMNDDQHHQLSETLKHLKGFVILSGYNNPIYEELYKDWIRIDKKAFADGARERTESLWLNKKASEEQHQQLLFK